MRRVSIGDTGLKVSRLCYGTEPFTFKKGPKGRETQGDIDPFEGGRRLAEAYELGVNFWDTSDDYDTHPHVREGLMRVRRGDVVVADKTNASTEDEGRRAVELSLKELNSDYVDIMFLHSVPTQKEERTNTLGRPYTAHPLIHRKGTLTSLLKAKDLGQIKAIALSTHSTAVLREALMIPEIDVVCTTLNMVGSFIDDGTLEDRIEALRDLKNADKFIYVIKVLDSGRLIDKAESAIRYALQFHDFVDAWNIGMYGVVDVKKNLRILKKVLN